MSVQAPPLSFSRLNTFHRCPKSYELRYIAHVPQEGSGALIGGKAVHSTIENAEAGGYWSDPEAFGENGQAVEVFDAFFDQYLSTTDEPIRWAGRKTKEFPAGEDAMWWRRNGRFMLRRYQDTRANLLADLSLVSGGSEMFVGATLSGGQYVRGYIDAFLASDSDGETVVVDYSTGKAGGKSPLQFATYARLLSEAGYQVARGVAVYLRATDPAKRLQWMDTRPLVPLIDQLYGSLAQRIASGTFEFNPDGWHSSCSVRAHCDYWQALVASGVEEEAP